MKLANRVRIMALTTVLALGALSSPSFAQEVSEEHLKAARAAIDAMNVTEDFDMILPQAAQELKATLIQQSPNMVNLINQTVDEKALQLASRRADLENEAARIYARVFTQEELQNIATFYTSPAGQKMLTAGVGAQREVINAAGIWREGVMRDLFSGVMETVDAAAKAQAPAQGAAPTQN